MSSYWLLVAFATVSIVGVLCETGPAAQGEKTRDGLSPEEESIFGFRPCLDETCEDYRPSDVEPKDHTSEAGKVELPRAHCMLLRPSAVNLFGDIEAMYPGIADIKYRLLEEMIEYMHQFSSLKLQYCQPNMQLIDLVILAANSLKTQYTLQGEGECIYESSEDKIGKPIPTDEETKVPCHSEYGTGCTETTAKPEIGTTKPTEIPYEPSSTQSTVSEEWYVPSSTKGPIVVEPTKKPYPHITSTEEPCEQNIGTVTEEYSDGEEIEIIAEEEESEPIIPQVGSLRGIPGVHYPNYTDIPITAFTCADKKYVPGFYADLDTGCQVFHVCYEHRRESFLCPVGTIFNQPILACDYWYSSNCSLASHYYDVNDKTVLEEEKIDAEVEEILTLIEDTEKPGDVEISVEKDLDKIAHFFPVKAVVTETKPEIVVPIESTTSYTEEVASVIVDKMATTATKIISSTRDIIKSIPEPVVVKPVFKPVPKPVVIQPKFFPTLKKPMKMADLLKEAVVPLVKAKLAAIPISKATAFKTAVPVAGFAKAKIAVPAIKTAAAVPVLAKAKFTAAAVPVIAKAKMAIPAVKAAAAVPVIAKAKMAIPAVKAAAAVPVIAKAKVAIPAVKAAAAVPVIAKAKVAAAIPAAKVAVAAPVVAAKVKKAAVVVPAAKVAAAAPIVKGKLTVPAFKVAASKVAIKSSVPVLKAKMLASSVPLAKTKIVPLMKAKVLKSAGTPLLKAKMFALPLAKSKLAGPLPIAKVKLAKAAAISPLTKKALALGYMKLLKAKKVALMG